MAELSGPQLLRCVPVAVQFLVILSYAPTDAVDILSFLVVWQMVSSSLQALFGQQFSELRKHMKGLHLSRTVFEEHA